MAIAEDLERFIHQEPRTYAVVRKFLGPEDEKAMDICQKLIAAGRIESVRRDGAPLVLCKPGTQIEGRRKEDPGLPPEMRATPKRVAAPEPEPEEDEPDEPGEETESEKPKEGQMAETMFTSEVAAELGIGTARALALYHEGVLKGKPEHDGARAPILFDRKSVEKEKERRKTEGNGKEHRKPAASTALVPVTRKPTHVTPTRRAPAPAPADQTRPRLAFVVLGVELGEFTEEEGWERVRRLAGRES